MHDERADCYLHEDGNFRMTGELPVWRALELIGSRLRLFLARIASCERTESGDFLLKSTNAGSVGGARDLWSHVTTLARVTQAMLALPATAEQRAEFARNGILTRTPEFSPRARPLREALHVLIFAVLPHEVGDWVGTMPASKVAQLRALEEELELHKRDAEPIRTSEPTDSRTAPRTTADLARAPTTPSLPAPSADVPRRPLWASAEKILAALRTARAKGEGLGTKELRALTGCSDDWIGKTIGKLRKAGYVIPNRNDGVGYFLESEPEPGAD